MHAYIHTYLLPTYPRRVRQGGGPVQKADAKHFEGEKKQHWSDAVLAAYADLDRWSLPVAGGHNDWQPPSHGDV